MIPISTIGRIAGVSYCLFLTACGGAQVRQNVELDAVLHTGAYGQAALMAEARMGLEPDNTSGTRPPVSFEPKHVLTHLEAAEAWRMEGDLQRSLEHYDAAETALAAVEENAAGQAMGKVGAALVNETLTTYVPSPAEAVMINYYKALTFWSTDKDDLARVEFNRADDRTRRAVERYAREIASAQAEAEKQRARQTYSDPAVASGINQHFPEMERWSPYAEFVVPPATYLHALFLATSDVPSDREKARELYERLGGIVGEHPTLATDMADVASGEACPTNDCIWVIVESGLGPELQERRFSYPILAGDQIVTAPMAIPALASRYDPSLASCAISHGPVTVDCVSIASMDRIIQTEFTKRFPGIVTRSIMSAAVKAVAQNEAGKQGGFAGLLLAAAVTTGLTTADVRMWRSLPGDFAIARLRRNGSPSVIVEIAGQQIDIPLREDGRQLVHVKVPVVHGKPAISLVSM
jgi:hypothetical protein